MKKISELIPAEVKELPSPYPHTVRLEVSRKLLFRMEEIFRTDRGTITDVSELKDELTHKSTAAIHAELYGEILNELREYRSVIMWSINFYNEGEKLLKKVDELIRTIDGYGDIRPVPILKRGDLLHLGGVDYLERI